MGTGTYLCTLNKILLYTIMCDVVAGALDKIRELKEEEKGM